MKPTEGQRLLCALQHALQGRGAATVVDARENLAGSCHATARHPPQITLNVGEDARAALAGSKALARVGIALFCVDATALAFADETLASMTAGPEPTGETDATTEPNSDP
jgi:hypothetical protein